MKILATGFTAKQRGHGRPRIFLLLDAVTLALESLGHEVTRTGNLLPGDPIVDEHDALIVGIYSYNSIAAFGSKVAMVDACTRKPYVVAWDDYHSREVFGSIAKGPSGLWRAGPMDGTDKWDQIEAAAEPNRKSIDSLAELWAQQIPHCLVAAFDWGDHSVLASQHSFHSLFPWDPSPWITDWYHRAGTETIAAKREEWVLASLSGQAGWVEDLDLKWDVNEIFKPRGGGQSRDWQMSEDEVYQSYVDAWGVLSPPYEHLFGSGWWRNRFALATLAGSILCCDPSEVSALPNSWYYTEPAAIEDMGLDSLMRLADRQNDEFWNKWLKPRPESAARLEKWLCESWSSQQQ